MHRFVFVLLCVLIPLVASGPAYAKNEVVSKREQQQGTKPPRYCQSQTPCSWDVYDNYYGVGNMMTIINVYCVCRPGTICDFHAKRVDGGYIEKRCRVKQLDEENSTENGLHY